MTVVERELQTRGLFDGIPDAFEVARYHSLYGARESFPDVLRATAVTADGVVRRRFFLCLEGGGGVRGTLFFSYFKMYIIFFLCVSVHGLYRQYNSS